MCDCVMRIWVSKGFFIISRNQGKVKWREGDKIENQEEGQAHTIAVDTESDNGEDELDSANGEVEIKSHCWEVCDLGVEYLDLVKARQKIKKVDCW